MKRWTLALSWGPSGGLYLHRGYCKRICLGHLALTFLPTVEIDDLMEAYAEDPTEEAQAETIHSLAIRFTEQEAELHRLREAAWTAYQATWLLIGMAAQMDAYPRAVEALAALRAALLNEPERR